MLAQLNRENGGFAFEPLARDLIHAEYCRNIVPATGPVSGGDRGEDARAHTNYILDSEDTLHLYEGLAPRTNERIIFAFSIREDWETKLDGDIKKIINNGLQPDKIVFATNQPITTRIRQDKEASVRKDNGCDLEILDGSWFAQHLETNHYDLAVKYLGCEQKLDTRLKEMFDRVLGFAGKTLSDDDRTEVERLQSQVRYRTAYTVPEHLVLDLKSLADIFANNAEHLDDAFRWYEEALREAANEHVEPRVLLDVYYAYFKALFKLPLKHKEIFRHLPEYRRIVFASNYRTYFIKVTIWQFFLMNSMRRNPEFLQFVRETNEYLANYDREGLSVLGRALLLEAEIDSEVAVGMCQGNVDYQQHLNRLNELVELVETTQFYDVDILARKISIMSPFLSGNEQYESLYDRVESLAASTLSDTERGSMRRTRGMAHIHNGDPVRGIQQFGIAKYHWKDFDSLREKVITSMLIALAYQDLEQYYAAEWELLQAIYLGTLLEDNLQLDLVCTAFRQLHFLTLLSGRLLTSIAFADLYLNARYRWQPDLELDFEFINMLNGNAGSALARLYNTNRPLHDKALNMMKETLPPDLFFYPDLVEKSLEELESEYAGKPEHDVVKEMYTKLRDGSLSQLTQDLIDEQQPYQIISFISRSIWPVPLLRPIYNEIAPMPVCSARNCAGVLYPKLECGRCSL